VAITETVDIVPHVPLRVAVDIQVPIVAVADIQLRATAAVGIQLRVAVEAADIQRLAVAEVAVLSTPLEATTRPIADDKNFEVLLRAAPQAAPFFFVFSPNRRSGRPANVTPPAPTKIDLWR